MLLCGVMLACKQTKTISSDVHAAPYKPTRYEDVLRAAAKLDFQSWQEMKGYCFMIDYTTFDIRVADSTLREAPDLEWVVDPQPGVHYYLKFGIEKADSINYLLLAYTCPFGNDSTEDTHGGPCERVGVLVEWGFVDSLFNREFNAILTEVKR